MRSVIIALPALLTATGCSTTAEGPQRPSTTGGTCAANGLDAYVGQTVTAALGAELLAKSGARTLRWGPPNAAMTMDFREDRLTVSYDERMTVTRLSCG